MKVSVVLPWVCVLGLLAAGGAMYTSQQKLQAEVERLTQENQGLKEQRADEANSASTQGSSEELARLRKDNEELLRLRNDVRQLRQEKQQLATQVQTAQAQAQDAQARAAAARQTGTIPAPMPTNYTLDRALPIPGGDITTLTCINNLRLIDGAKAQWAADRQKPAYTLVSAADLTPYLRTNSLPSCPAGGVYNLNGVGQPPTCSIPGHMIPK